MPFFVIKKGLVLLEWKYFPTPKILDPQRLWDFFIVVCRKNNGEWSMTNKLNNILSELKEF